MQSRRHSRKFQFLENRSLRVLWPKDEPSATVLPNSERHRHGCHSDCSQQDNAKSAQPVLPS
ncbi:hypothetical protein EVA_04635 [gut metagenome]|uniref:Uncharacterized protein n=1 Tax=gut metagenome TaxID=749906 RepID=J9GJ54_9ZZZZ